MWGDDTDSLILIQAIDINIYYVHMLYVAYEGVHMLYVAYEGTMPVKLIL